MTLRATPSFSIWFAIRSRSMPGRPSRRGSDRPDSGDWGAPGGGGTFVSRNGKDDLDQFASDEFLRLFDFPLMHASVAKRPTTVAPQQFLFLMNSRFIAERSAALAMRLAQEADSDEARIDLAYRILFGRLPKGREKLAGMTFLTQATAAPEGNMTPVQQYARVLLCSNELMYVR